MSDACKMLLFRLLVRDILRPLLRLLDRETMAILLFIMNPETAIRRYKHDMYYYALARKDHHCLQYIIDAPDYWFGDNSDSDSDIVRLISCLTFSFFNRLSESAQMVISEYAVMSGDIACVRVLIHADYYFSGKVTMLARLYGHKHLVKLFTGLGRNINLEIVYDAALRGDRKTLDRFQQKGYNIQLIQLQVYDCLEYLSPMYYPDGSKGVAIPWKPLDWMKKTKRGM